MVRGFQGSKVPRSRGSRVPGFAISVAALGLLLSTRAAFAQERQPLPAVVLELRGTTGSLPADVVTAADLGLSPLPDRAWGGVAGIHVYPGRRRGIALGVGAEGVLVRAQARINDAAGVLTEARVVRQLQGLSGIVSVNFGHADGWSHISAGAGPLRFTNTISPPAAAQALDDTAPYALTLNAGAGARWFLSRHAAFGFDVRFYFTRARATAPGLTGRESGRIVLLSAGVTIK